MSYLMSDAEKVLAYYREIGLYLSGPTPKDPVADLIESHQRQRLLIKSALETIDKAHKIPKWLRRFYGFTF